jgi:DNA-binding transcriptional LysR family regulator
MKLTSQDVSPADMVLYADVVQLGSFTATARQHGISKQAVSERIIRLESALGVRLLQRTTRRLNPTEAGMRYFTECLQIATLIEQANVSMQAEQIEPRGVLTVSAPILFGRGRLIEVLRLYQERYPKVRVDLRLADRLVNLIEEGVDVALRVSHLEDRALSVRCLGSAKAFFVVSPKLRRRFGAASDTELVRTAPAITFRTGEVWELPDGTRTKPKVVMNIDDLLGVTAAAVDGIGIARLPGQLCHGLVTQNKLKVLFDRAPAASFSVYAAYQSQKQLAPKIRSFVDMLVEHRSKFTDGDE